MAFRLWAVAAICSALCLAIASGCTQPAGSRSNDGRSQRLMTLISLKRTVGGAKSEADFKQAITRKVPADVLSEMLADAKVDSVDQLFISERDGQPFVIFYLGQRPAEVANDLFAYEQDGVDGKRLVAYGIGSFDEVDEQRFNELVPPAHRPKK